MGPVVLKESQATEEGLGRQSSVSLHFGSAFTLLIFSVPLSYYIDSYARLLIMLFLPFIN